MSSVPDFTKHLATDTRQFPALIAALVLLGTLLFYDKLADPLKNWFVPSLAVYVVGASLIGYVQTMLHIRRQSFLPSWIFTTIVVFHVAWFASFVAYNILYRASF